MRSQKEAVAEIALHPKNEDAERKKAAQRDKRAQSLAAMGLVTREGSRYHIKSAAMRGQQENYEVWRDERGRVRCSCAEFERQSSDDPAFRCEHILAVKYSLTPGAPNADQPAPRPAASAPASQPAPPAASPIEDAAEEELHDNAEPEEESREETEMQIHHIEPEHNHPEIEPGIRLETEPSPAAVLPMPTPFATLLRTLRRPVDPRLVKAREGWTDRGGATHWVEYIEWHTAADILDRVAPNWSHAVRNITQIGDVVAVTASITIDGVTREGIGTGPAETETGIKKAEHDALKRAAVKFGIARDLYQRDSEAVEEDGIAPSVVRDPRPKTLNDMVTPKQLWMIRNLGREIGCNVEQECKAMLQCSLEEISKRAASSFIDYLKRRQQEEQPEELRRAS